LKGKRMAVWNSAGNRFKQLLGIEQSSVSRLEQALSGIGGLLGIVAILMVSGPLLHEPAGAVVVASMGASAVLLFAVPHGPLSQPWALLGGHQVSAFIGVSCAALVPEPVLAAGLAVGLSIAAMHLLRCIHPPGGATALAAVVGGTEVQALGYQYMLTPVLLNVVVILLVAFLFNYPFRWRRYPVALSRLDIEREEDASGELLDHDHLMRALGKLDTFMDISEQDLLKIYRLASGDNDVKLAADQIRSGACFSNGAYGAEWQVREVLDAVAADDDRKIVSYRVLAGHGRKTVGKCGLLEFSRWARYRVVRNENSWQRVTD
jgi:CBS domain-containing membrane protein